MTENVRQDKPISGSITPDYSFVDAIARVAVYDGVGAAPKVLEITPDKTDQFIEHLTDAVNDEAKKLGGKIPYSAIRQGVENLIHAQFHGCVISIMDGGNTIRIADHGPGIKDIKNAVKPGFTSATETMQKYIRGVGSGIPLMRDYVESRHGHININSNLDSGTVLTITIDPESPDEQPVLEYQQGDDEPRRMFGDVRDGFQTEGSRENLMNRYDVKARGDHYAGTQGGPRTDQERQNMQSQQTYDAYQPYVQQAYPQASSARNIPANVQGGFTAPMPYQNPTQQPVNYMSPYQPAYQTSYQAQQPLSYAAQQPPVSAMQQQTSKPPMILNMNDKDKTVLVALFTHDPDPMGPSDVTAETGINKSTVFVAFSRLEKQNLVRNNKRGQRSLTPQGKSVAESLYRNI